MLIEVGTDKMERSGGIRSDVSIWAWYFISHVRRLLSSEICSSALSSDSPVFCAPSSLNIICRYCSYWLLSYWFLNSPRYLRARIRLLELRKRSSMGLCRNQFLLRLRTEISMKALIAEIVVNVPSDKWSIRVSAKCPGARPGGSLQRRPQKWTSCRAKLP
jgi:hypothetical protein